MTGDTLLVRARIDGDIERVFPAADVIEGAGTDYRYRARVSRAEVTQAMTDAVEAIDYGNFKNSIPKYSKDRHDAYMSVWTTMMRHTLGRYNAAVSESQGWWKDYHTR